MTGLLSCYCAGCVGSGLCDDGIPCAYGCGATAATPWGTCYQCEVEGETSQSIYSLGRCGNEQEPDGVVCEAEMYVTAGAVQAQCPGCGAWTGVCAPGCRPQLIGAGDDG